MEIKDRLNIYIPTRLKRRLKEVADDKGMKMNDLVVTAISDMLDRVDMDHSAPDIVLDRLTQVLNSQMLLVSEVNKVNDKLGVLVDEEEEE